MDKLEKLEQKKARVLPQSRRGKSLALKIATINERERIESLPQEPQFAGIEVFNTDDSAQKDVSIPDQQPQVDVAPTPLPSEISNFEDPRTSYYTGMVIEDLGNPNMQDISEATKQALLDAPFSKSFRQTMTAFVAVQKYRAGKGPMYRGEVTQD